MSTRAIKKIHFYFTFFCNFLLMTSLSLSVSAKDYEDFFDITQNSELIAQFHDWFLFKHGRGDQEICYLLSTPISSQRTTRFREESYFIITLNADLMDEVSTSLGFYFKENSNVELSFGSKKFYLFPYRNLAWANNKNEDIDIVKAMKNKDRMFVTGVSKNGELVIDIYSLVGYNQAYRKMR